MRTHAKDLGVFLNSVQPAVRNDLNSQSLVRKCVPLLSEKNITARLKRCRSLVNHLKHADSGRILFFSDEKNVCVDPVRNSRNDRYIRLEDSEVDEDVLTAAKFITKTKHPASVMFLGAVTSTDELSFTTDLVLADRILPFCVQLPGSSLKNSDPVNEKSCREAQQGLYIPTGWRTSSRSMIDAGVPEGGVIVLF